MSKKIYKGYELYIKIANGEIDKNSKFKDNNNIIWIWNGTDFETEKYSYSDIVFSQMDFELVDEIDIDSIEEIDNITPIYNYYLKINELVQAVKQLNKEIKSIKERR